MGSSRRNVAGFFLALGLLVSGVASAEAATAPTKTKAAAPVVKMAPPAKPTSKPGVGTPAAKPVATTPAAKPIAVAPVVKPATGPAMTARKGRGHF